MAEVSLQLPLPVSERIPESAKFSGLESGSVIRGRRTIMYQPSTGPSVNSTGGSQIITFRIADSNAFLDTLSTYLTFDVALTDVSATTGGCAWDDSIISLFNRVKCEINSVQADDIVNVDSLAHGLIYALGNRDAYEGDMGTMCGAWKWNARDYGHGNQTSLPSDTAAAATGNQAYNSEGSQDAVARRAKVFYRSNYSSDAIQNTTSSTYKFRFAVPLSYFGLGIFKNSTFFPLRNMGVLSLSFYTNTANRALRTGVAGAAIKTGAGEEMVNAIALPGAAGFQISNLAIVGQLLDMDPRYLEITDRICTTSESGLVMPFETFTNTSSSYATPVSDVPTEKTIVVSKASTSLRNMYIQRSPASWRENGGKCGITGFPYMNCDKFRVQLGSYYTPEYGPAVSPAQQLALLKQSHGLLGNQDALGNLRVDGYINAPSATSDINGQHVLGVGFDRSVNQYLALDGLNSVSSGGTLSIQLSDSGYSECGSVAGAAIAFNAWIEFTRFLQMRMNAVSVVG